MQSSTCILRAEETKGTQELEQNRASERAFNYPSAAQAALFFAPVSVAAGQAQDPSGATIGRMELLIVSLASLLAGLIDAIVGGGGLILLPVLFATFPGAAPATLFGTNKSASIWGTAFATVQYSRQVVMPWRSLLPAAGAGLVGSLAGAWVVTHVDPTLFRKALPIMLTALLVYTVAKKDLGRSHAPRFIGRQEALMAAGIGLVIGFYDGFFGPGTGSFLVFAYVRLMGYDFLNASASAKLINVATNFSALVLFAIQGHVWWHLALAMAVANMVGSLVGTRLALKHGSGFVRHVFMVVVLALICKTAYDTWLR
jgi:uncharacterized membrane protein YfcA